MLKWLKEYWRITVRTKPLAEVDAEQWLFTVPLRGGRFFVLRCLRFHRVYIAFASCLAQFCCALIYAMAATAAPVTKHFFPDNTASTPVKFYFIGMIAYCVTAAFLGPALERNGPRWSMTIGSLFTFAGCVVLQVAISTTVFVLMYIGVLLTGVGLGCVLVTSMATPQKWAPDWRGTMSGVSVLGFGLGQVGWTAYFQYLQQHFSLNYLYWLVLAVIVPALAISTLILRTPPPSFIVNGIDMHAIPANRALLNGADEYLKVGMTLLNYNVIDQTTQLDGTARQYHEQVKALTLLQCIASTDFISLCIAFVGVSVLNLPYLVLQKPGDAGVQSIKNTYNVTQVDANNLVIVGAAVGFAGRLVIPILSDVIIRVFYANPAFGRKIVFTVVLLVEATTLPVLSLDTFESFQSLIYVSRVCSGAGGSLIACFLTDMYGVYNTGTMYGLTWTIWSVVLLGVSPLMSNGVTNYQIHIFWILSLVGLLFMVFVRTNSSDRFYQGYQLSLCHKVIVQIPFGKTQSSEEPLQLSPVRGSFFIYETDSDRGVHKISV